MAGILKMPVNGELMEGHPIGLDKIILGDRRKRTWESNGQTYVNENTEGTILYDCTDHIERPWFILVYESGRRVVE